jgi:hypothetical protein
MRFYFILSHMTLQGEEARPTPWNSDGIRHRAERLQRNSLVRTLDAGVWTGLLAAGAVLYCSKWIGSPPRIRQYLSPGLFGTSQFLSIGTALGSIAAIGVHTLIASPDRTKNEI